MELVLNSTSSTGLWLHARIRETLQTSKCVNELEEGLASAQRNYAQPLRSKFERVAVKHSFGVEDARRLV